MEIAQQFGIKPILLAAQIVNFLIILFVLKRFFYKPIVKMLEERRRKIEESLKNAEVIEQKLADTQEKSAAILESARENAERLITDAKTEGQRLVDKAAAEARAAAEETLKKAMEQIQAEKIQMQKELEQETLDLVVLTVKKILGRNLKDSEKKDLTAKSIGDITRKMSS